MMKLFCKIDDGFRPLTVFTKEYVTDVWQGPKYSSGSCSEQFCKVQWKVLVMKSFFTKSSAEKLI